MSTIQRALEIAVHAHSCVIDKSGKPYIFHPLRLVLKAETEDEQIVAALHDVVEDCEDWTIERLREEGFSDVVVDAVERLTRLPNETYEEFVERCCGSLVSTKVKLLDITDNMDITRLPTMEQKDMNRVQRYHKARIRLLNALKEW